MIADDNVVCFHLHETKAVVILDIQYIDAMANQIEDSTRYTSDLCSSRRRRGRDYVAQLERGWW